MRTMLISDNNDTLVGMRLGGVKSVLASNREAIEFALSKEEVGILIVTERVFDMAKAELLDIRMNRRTPLIVEIPDRHGQIRDDNYITQYINESVGIKL